MTLAEVLVVITVIGVAASLTIPTLIKSYKTQVTIAKVKNVVSDLSRAAKQLQVNDFGGHIIYPTLLILTGCHGGKTSLKNILGT